MAKAYPEQLVFGLDIGTRSLVGTVGYKKETEFIVVAQKVLEHETRSMLDGQIHDIEAVGRSIKKMKEALEKVCQRELTDVCIAAAGRVLKTVQVHVNLEFPEEKEITSEDCIGLTSAGIEQAYLKLQEEKDLFVKFYCVGHTIQKYFINDYAILNPIQHKGKKLSADMIATFLPDDVVDGLYKAVSNAGMNVANLTLEPIAAIQVAIPQNYRMLNIALIDVGAGTSDICITKNGMVAAYGMIPIAGDSITEQVAQQCLVDFDTAEVIKRGICEAESVEYRDIMGLKQVANREEILNACDGAIEKMASQAAEKIKQLNGNEPVSAVFVVGGGGRILGYTDKVAEHLGIPKERCAVRGEDVMTSVKFQNKGAIKDSLMVTPIGICLCFYEQSNHFVFVTFNNQRVKLYDNNHLSVMDAALQANFDHEMLFPRRGKELTYYVEKKKRMVRGELGEAAVILLNGKEADLHTPIRKNDLIQITPSTAGAPAGLMLQKVPEIHASIRVNVNDKPITLPAFAKVNGKLETEYYEIQDGDRIEIIQYYTIRQIAEVMDVVIDESLNIYVNNKLSDIDTKVYDNFSVIFTMETLQLSDVDLYENLPEDDGEYERMKNETNELSKPVLSEKEDTMTEFSKQDVKETDAFMKSDSDSSENEPPSWDVEEQAENGNSVEESEKKDVDCANEEENEAEDKNGINRSLEPKQSENNQKEENLKEQVLTEEEKKQRKKVERMITAVNGDAEALLKSMEDDSDQIISVWVNQQVVTLKGKKNYVFVDIFEYFDFDLSKPKGKELITNVNGQKAQFMQPLKTGDQIDVYWIE